jgi:hypothetical protein
MKILGATTIIAPVVLILLTIWMAFAFASPARAQVGGGYYAAPAPWWGGQRYGIPSGPQCRSNTGIRRPGWCGGPVYDPRAYGPLPADIPLPPPGGAWSPVSYPLWPLAYASPPPPPVDYAPPPVEYVAPPDCDGRMPRVSKWER